MPIVASMGGNAGTQTVTVAVRAIAMREFSTKTAITFGLRELYVGVINGVLFAVLAAGLAYVWFGQTDIALIIAIAMCANIVVAAISGTLVPLALIKLGSDPAIASSVFITTITDVVGFMGLKRGRKLGPDQGLQTGLYRLSIPRLGSHVVD